MKLRYTLIGIIFLLEAMSGKLYAQMLVTNTAPYNTANYLINDVFSDGSVSINNIQVFGQNGQYGFFNNG